MTAIACLLLYRGMKLGIYPRLIFIGVGAMTNFGSLIANSKRLLGAAAFMIYVDCRLLGFTVQKASPIGIIGSAAGPTAVFVIMPAPALLGSISVSSNSCMVLVPVVQPPIMKLFITEEAQEIVIKPLRKGSPPKRSCFPSS